MTQEVSDSSDWQDAHMREFESLLRCEICRDYFQTALLLPTCDHSFCALCLRQSMVDMSGSDNECPVCRQKFEMASVRNNKVLDRLVSTYYKVRNDLLMSMNQSNRKKRHLEIISLDDDDDDDDNVSSTSKHTSKRVEKDLENEPQTPKIKNSISCPKCHRLIRCKPEEFDLYHFQKCLYSHEASTKTKSTQIMVKPTPLPVFVQRKRLPLLWYQGMKRNDLKQELAKHNLDTTGDINAMKVRHKQFVLFWNAACDSNSPVSNEQILQQVQEWEQKLTVKDKPATINPKTHSKKYSKDFDMLIRNAKRTLRPRVKNETNTCEVVIEDDNVDNGEASDDSNMYAIPDDDDDFEEAL